MSCQAPGKERMGIEDRSGVLGCASEEEYLESVEY